MFLFRDRQGRQQAGEASPAQRAGEQQGTAAPPAAGGAAGHEFFAFKAARLIGGAARQVGASIARIAAGPSAEALRADLETRATGPAEGLAAGIAEWARLLAATDDTPRYEATDGGPPLTFRAAFLRSRAFELALAAAPVEAQGAGRVSDATWQGFLRGAALQGGEETSARLSQLLTQTRHLPDCRRWVEEVALAVKADARSEQLRSERTTAGARAEQIRGELREARRKGSGGGPEEPCRASHEAVRLYAAFRRGLGGAVAHLRWLLAERGGRLEAAREALRELSDVAAGREAAAIARREEVQQQQELAVGHLRRAVQELERDPGRQEADQRTQELEQRRKQLQMQLEEVSQALAAKRNERLALLHRRDEAMAEHRRRAEAVERQIQELRPAQFHRVVTPRVDAMTEGEIVSGLGRAADAVQSLAGRVQASSSAASAKSAADVQQQREALEKSARASLQRHAQLELARLEAAGSAVVEATGTLLEIARRRSEMAAMGMSPDDEGGPYAASTLPQRRDVRKLRGALVAARAAWEEAADRWGGDEGAKAGEDSPAVLSALEAARARISGSLGQLQGADPLLYDLAMQAVGEDAEDAAEDLVAADPDSAASVSLQLPHGWQAHAAPDGNLYFYSLVTRESQWEPPTQDAAVAAGWRLFQAEDGNWFYHNPYDGEGIWWPDLPEYAALPESLDALAKDAQLAGRGRHG